MGPQMLGEVVDPFGKQRNLDLGRTRVRGVRAELFYDDWSVFHKRLP
jgi:hypothetical protein